MAPAPTPPPRARLSTEAARQAVPRLEARIRELRELDLRNIHSAEDPAIEELEARIRSTLASIYGEDAAEYRRLVHAAKLDQTSYRMAGTSVQEIRAGLNYGRMRAISLLSGEVTALRERPDFGEQLSEATGTAKALPASERLDLHPEIARAASKLYRDGHISNAIENAVKALNDLVRLRSGVGLDGTTLMEKVFSPKKPILRFNDLKDQPDQDEQNGYMMMFSGVVAELHNPRAYRLIKDDPERALEFIAFVSLLAKLLDSAKK